MILFSPRGDGFVADPFESLHLMRRYDKMKVLPYHNYADSKYAALRMKNTLPDTLPENSTVQTVQLKCIDAVNKTRRHQSVIMFIVLF